jgi:hypothetical protein
MTNVNMVIRVALILAILSSLPGGSVDAALFALCEWALYRVDCAVAVRVASATRCSRGRVSGLCGHT